MDLKFGGGSITEIEWNWIKETCELLKAKTVIEVGSGFSTTCFMNIMEHVDSYETNDAFIKELNSRVDHTKVNIIKYNYPIFPVNKNKYDVAFVDGPGQNNNNGRMNSMLFVEPLSDYVFIHDFSRKGEKISRETVFQDMIWEISGSKSRTLLMKRKIGQKSMSIQHRSIVENQYFEPTQAMSQSSVS